MKKNSEGQLIVPSCPSCGSVPVDGVIEEAVQNPYETEDGVVVPGYEAQDLVGWALVTCECGSSPTCVSKTLEGAVEVWKGFCKGLSKAVKDKTGLIVRQ